MNQPRIDGQGLNPWIGNPLFGRYDLDPGRYRPQFYGLKIDVPVTEGGLGEGTVNISNEPFCMTRITHRIIGDFNDPAATGLYQDGLYDIEWKDETHAYCNEPINANLMFGWDQTGYLMILPYPIGFPGNKTVSFRITNRIARVLVPEANYFRVELCLAGINDLGKLPSRQNQ